MYIYDKTKKTSVQASGGYRDGGKKQTVVSFVRHGRPEKKMTFVCRRMRFYFGAGGGGVL